MINSSVLQQHINELKTIQDEFRVRFGISDLISNSKIFEAIIANTLNHDMLLKLSGARDAKDHDGEYEYKHYKESSSNHTWTFNDYSDTTIEKLKVVKAVIFAHINDATFPPSFDWYYYVPGKMISEYLKVKTKPIKNKRKMLNVSSSQIEDNLKIRRVNVNPAISKNKYTPWLKRVFEIAQTIENAVGTKNILTSNKFWELLIAVKMNHRVLSEQTAFDATDNDGNFYEYKVSRSESWNFEDISDEVLKKFYRTKAVLLAKVDKVNFLIKTLYIAEPHLVVSKLKQKLSKKRSDYATAGKELRRLQVSLSKNDILAIKGNLIYSSDSE